MTLTTYKMLGELLHHCTKCGLTLNHRITLMNGSVPARVLCLTCKSERAFRAVNTPGSSIKRKVASGTVRSSTARTASEDSAWRLKLSDRSKTPQTYAASGRFQLDDHIYHPTFGRGVVVEFIHPDKIKVFFEDGVKVLKGNKS